MKAADAYRRKRLSPKSDGDTTDRMTRRYYLFFSIENLLMPNVL